MSSPIHKYLFSPPSSPPSRASSGKHRPPPLNLSSSISPILDQLSPRLSSQFSPRLFSSSSSSSTSTATPALIPRSPRTPQNKFQFTLNDTFPTRTPRQGDIDLESAYSPQATPRVIVTHPTTPSRTTTLKTLIHSPQLIPSNIPSQSSSSTSTYTISASLPKPLLRLLFLLTLLTTSIILLVYIPSTRMPSLRQASDSRRLAYDQDGKAWLDLMRPVKSWGEGLDRDYKPAMVKSSKMMKRGVELLGGGGKEVVEEVQVPLIAESALRASNPKPIPRPLPKSHELVALQSYLLGSAYNTLPLTLDTTKPLDANTILGFKGDLEEMLVEMEGEHGDEVVVWYGGDGISQIPHSLLDHLSQIHGPNHKPTLLPLHSRPDRSTLISLFSTHDLPLATHPIVMIGNKPVIADKDGMERMRGLMSEIGWVKADGERKGTGKGEGWKPKFAVVRKREISEVEKALEEVTK